MQVVRSIAAVALGGLLLSGCGQVPAPIGTAVPTAAPSPTALVESPAPSAEPTPANQRSSASPTPKTAYSPASTASAQPPAPGRLTLNQFHNPSEGWTESTFDVAGRKSVEGFAYELRCGFSDPQQLELRLQNSYQELKFSVGQEDNQSGPADQQVEVQINANNKPVQSRKVPFNQVEPFEVSVRDVNSLVLDFSIDRAGSRTCRNNIQVVVFDAQLS